MSDEIEQVPAQTIEGGEIPDGGFTGSIVVPGHTVEEGDGSAVDLGIPDAGASLFRDNFTSPHVKADQHV